MKVFPFELRKLSSLTSVLCTTKTAAVNTIYETIHGMNPSFVKEIFIINKSLQANHLASYNAPIPKTANLTL